MRGPVSPSCFELEFDFAAVCDFQTFIRERAAGNIFDQLFQTVTGVGICRSIAVQAKPIDAEAALSFCECYFFEITKPASDSGYVFASIFSEGNFASNGCVSSGSDGFVFLEEVVHQRVLHYFPVFIQVTFFCQVSHDILCDIFTEPHHFVIGDSVDVTKLHHSVYFGVNTVKQQYMKMRIYV
jgi:hypothetical protein